ncbi:MAG: preprotein translocase subunit SecG [Gracilimonas sp.]|jgi:preprotein translocase subunit SecG|uniref:preprotein translocase subunit SecG n=1 Tax=Gracilimonas sp. TaxID=1974203 RepID=UPI00199FAEC4|nr:preprotein translocase subunit SecG [Gracilimonas sp.]MBD3617547.1 preprotein translocase subunit SecG [Gracilimonas sp.]
MLYNIIVGVIAVICFLLIVVVLLQPGQGQGISGMGGAGAIGGGGGLGARRTADLLSKATSILAAIFLTLCVLANFAIDRGEVDRSILQEGVPGGVNAPIEAPSQTQPAIPQQQDQGNSEDDGEN